MDDEVQSQMPLLLSAAATGGKLKVLNYKAGLIVFICASGIVETSGSSATGANMKTTIIEQFLRLTTVAIIPQVTRA